jgi:hypothetical protein
VRAAIGTLFLLVACEAAPPDPGEPWQASPFPPTLGAAPGSSLELRLFGTCVPFPLANGTTTCVNSTPQNGRPGRLTPEAAALEDEIPGRASSALRSSIPAASALPPRIDHRGDYLDGCVTISNQAHCSWCTVHAATGLLEALHCSKGCDVPELSESHLRYESWGRSPLGECHTGWDVTQALSQLTDTPIVPASVWPYVGSGRSMDALKPPDAELDASAVHAATSYRTLGTTDLTQIKRVLASEREVMVGVPVHWGGGWDSGTTVITPPPPDAELAGYHAVVVVGYDDAAEELIFLNSWGEDWGEAGYGRMSYEFLTTLGGGGGYLEDVDVTIEGNACDGMRSSCGDHTTCADCTARSGCGWCGDGDGACIADAERDECTDFRAFECSDAGDPCAAAADCAACTAVAGCAYCQSSGRCYSVRGRVTSCTDPRAAARLCGDCAALTDCASCTDSTACGWCETRDDMGRRNASCEPGGSGPDRETCRYWPTRSELCAAPPSAPTTDCVGCLDVAGYGFCHDTSECLVGGQDGPLEGVCGEWAWFEPSCERMPSKMCPTVGQTCGGLPDCCPGELCVVDTCEDCAGSLFIGAPCTDTAECCGQMICSPVADAADLRCCFRDQDPCEVDSDCCGAMTCVDQRCQCQPSGAACLTGQECCGGSICTDGVCT